MELEQLKRQLEQLGERNDSMQQARHRKLLNITRDTGELLSVLVQTRGAQAVLEIGTSNGYSTLWLAEAVRRLEGHVTTIELDEDKRVLAHDNFQRAGLAPWVTLLAGDASELLPTLPQAGYQLIFLDSDRQHYRAWWPPSAGPPWPAGGRQRHLPSQRDGGVDERGRAGSGLCHLAGAGRQGGVAGGAFVGGG